MFTELPYIVEGEIIDVQKRRNPVSERGIVRYLCKVTMPDGSVSIIPNVQSSTIFGGISDYFQYRAKSSKDGGEHLTQDTDEQENAKTGDRVYIAFVNGNIMKPIIIGYVQHPNQSVEFPTSPDSADKKAILQYNGIRIEIGENGDLSLMHKGAPEVSYLPTAGLPAAAGALSDALPGGPINPAVQEADRDGITVFEFLDGGIMRLRDSEGQIFELDPTTPRIYISNNDRKANEPEKLNEVSAGLSALASENILFDKGEGLLKLSATSTLHFFSQDALTIEVLGDADITITGDLSETILGSVDTTITGDKSETITGSVDMKIIKDFSLSAGIGGLSIGKDGKVAIGSKAAELLDLIDQTLTAIQALTVGTGTGPSSPPINTATFTQIQAKLSLIKGSL
jgi:hypothetical protein